MGKNPENSYDWMGKIETEFVMSLVVRKIRAEDDPHIAVVIRSVLEEHGVTMPGTAYHDKSLDYMSSFHHPAGSIYFVAEWDGKIIGGSGIYPTQGLPENTCELVKMYVLNAFRGRGVARLLLEKCIEFSATHGYKNIYLETLPELSNAVGMYQKFGFKKLDEPLGNTGHFACTLRMLLVL